MPVVIRIIQKYCGTEYISDSYEKYFKDKQELQQKMILEIEKKCFDNVIPRFQPFEQNDYYQHFYSKAKNGKGYKSSSEKYIILRNEALTFFKKDYETLSKILVLEWAKFLEKTNFTPRLISKIELMKDPKRSSLTKFRKVLIDMNKECFYCSSKLEEGDIHIDHFIPWSYIYEDEIWNLVPACSRCNLIKSDALPPKACMEKIITRNKSNELTKWNSDIEEYYENCYRAGFQIVNQEKLDCNGI
jgi:5-methylcytosine-specific restriction endonuclease McrA